MEYAHLVRRRSSEFPENVCSKHCIAPLISRSGENSAESHTIFRHVTMSTCTFIVGFGWKLVYEICQHKLTASNLSFQEINVRKKAVFVREWNHISARKCEKAEHSESSDCLDKICGLFPGVHIFRSIYKREKVRLIWGTGWVFKYNSG